jgi:beta-lactamase superfamily II metal-dependent hydrolase
MTITVLYNAIGSDANNSSIVVMLEYESFRFLFMGDIGEEVEKKLVSAKVDLTCDVLKVGHHGSRYSSTASFLSAVKAEYGVICVGAKNSHGHPTDDALRSLNAAGVSVYRTDQLGDIVFSTNGDTLYLPNGTADTTGSVKS